MAEQRALRHGVVGSAGSSGCWIGWVRREWMRQSGIERVGVKVWHSYGIIHMADIRPSPPSRAYLAQDTLI